MITETYLGKLVISLPMLYLGLTAIPAIEFLRQMTEMSVLGFSMSTLMLIFAVVIFDFITGIAASKYEGQKLKSSKGLKTVYKLISYFLTMWAIAMLEEMCTNKQIPYASALLDYFRIGLFSLAFLWEFYSIGENIERRTGSKPRLFSFLDKITNLLEKKINDRISEEEPSAEAQAKDTKVDDVTPKV